MENPSVPGAKVKTCPHCKLAVDPKASRCPHCQGKIYQWTLGRKIIAGLVLFMFLPILIALASDPSSSSPSVPSTTTTETPSSGPVRQGDEGYLRMSSGDETVVLRTKELLDEYIKAAVNKDTYGMATIIYNDGGFFVPNGTKVLVIDSTVGSRQVRILEGQHLAESGWVPKEFVLKQ